MEASFEKRKLTDREVYLLYNEIKKFPNPLTDKKTWQSLKKVYILYNDKDIIGVCAIRELDKWVKLGPFVVFKKYHKQGFGKMILHKIVRDYSNSNLYIGSRNPAVAAIATSLGFQEEKNIWTLPKTIKLYLVENILQNLSFEYFKEFLRKKPTQEGSYRFFLRRINN